MADRSAEAVLTSVDEGHPAPRITGHSKHRLTKIRQLHKPFSTMPRSLKTDGLHAQTMFHLKLLQHVTE